MNAKQRENLRLLILTALDASKPYAVEIPTLRPGLPPAFRSLTDCDLWAEIEYLVEKGFAAPQGKPLSPENSQWKITAAGRDFLATEGLA
jgi:hypothetical protein